LRSSREIFCRSLTLVINKAAGYRQTISPFLIFKEAIMKQYKLSDFGQKMTTRSGILQLMDDLGRAMNGTTELKAMFGGGNPAIIPEVTSAFETRLKEIMKDQTKLRSLLGTYDTPQGNAEFISAASQYFSAYFHQDISPKNIAITPGSQTGFFMLFNMLAGSSSGSKRKILFPLVPEYIGYSDQLAEHEMISSTRPLITKIGTHEFKYSIDFDQLDIDEHTAAICVSRPTNPSGNVISQAEVKRLQSIARERGMPLIIDNAYGEPFPGVIDGDGPLDFDGNTIFSFSLSKVGLPGSRTGIFVGPEELMESLSSLNAIVALSSPNFGQYLATDLLQSGEIDRLSQDYIQPYYEERRLKAKACIEEYFDPALPWRFHTYQGSYFFWLWLEGTKIPAKELYSRLKDKGVLVVPGDYFFIGQDAPAWPHARECLRLNFARPDDELEAGLKELGSMIADVYQTNS